MKIVIVDDNIKFANKLELRLATHRVCLDVDYSRQNPYKIAESIAGVVGDESEIIIFINLNLKCDDKIKGEILRKDQAGSDILKHLRLRSEFFSGDAWRKNNAQEIHCVVYSYISLEETLQSKPENLLLLAPGNTYLHLPNDFADLILDQLVTQRFKSDSAQIFLRGSAFIPDNRHSLANWWGVKQLWEVHSLATDSKQVFYPPHIRGELEILENIQAVSIYSHSNTNLNNAYENRKAEISCLKKNISRRRPCILHVDDRWDDGWSITFFNMIYPSWSGRTKEGDFVRLSVDEKLIFNIYSNYDVKNGDSNETVKTIYEKIKDFINLKRENTPDVILLDLRLFGDREEQVALEELSGTTLLNLLRKDFVGIPVIMTTASNKAWSQEKLMRLGADGYWIKEGIDGRNTAEDTVENYVRLLWLIEKASADKYQFLSKLASNLYLMKKNGPHWWKDHKWRNSERTTADVNTIYKILDETLQIVRTYLHYFEMGYGFQNIYNQDFWHSAIIRHSALTLEEVHGSLPGGARSLGGLTKDRKDDKGRKLLVKRNEATHLLDGTGRYRKPISWKELQDFLINLVDYLSPTD